MADQFLSELSKFPTINARIDLESAQNYYCKASLVTDRIPEFYQQVFIVNTWYREYLSFVRSNVRFLCFTSSAGQTFFIGIFGQDIRSEFSLSHTQWGALYLMGTLASALLLPWSGQLIDRIELRWFVCTALLGLVIACISISLVNSVVSIALAVFLLRQFGQGLTGLRGSTSMARCFGANLG